MPKVLTAIAGLIVLVIAVEAGYFWGLRRSASFTVPQINITQQPQAANESAAPTPFPASMIPSLLSYQAAVAIGQNSPNVGVWQSDWAIGLSGVLVSLQKTAVSIDTYAGERKAIDFPDQTPVTYSKWSSGRKVSSESNSSEFNPGDNISISFTIETTNGNFKRLEIIKNVD